MTPYNERQYRLMLDRLEAYSDGKIGLNKLTDDINGLLHALEGADPAWLDKATSAWSKLEDAWGSIRNGYQGDLSANIQQGVRELHSMVSSALGLRPSSSGP